MNNKNFLSNIRSPFLDSPSSDVSHGRRSAVVRPSFGRRSTLLKLMSILAILLTVGVEQMWGAITNNNDGTYTETSGTGTISSNVITWSFAGGNVTVKQSATGGNNPSSSYLSAARVYAKNTLTVAATNGFKIEKVEIVVSTTYYGAGVQAGTSVSSNTVGNLTDVTTSLTSSSGGTHSFTPATDGAKTQFYIRNQNTGSTNTQLRWASGKLKVTYSYTKPSAVASGTVTSSSFGLSITDALNTNKYDVYFSTSSTAPTATTTASVANQTTQTPTISSGVSAGQTYYVWVRSVKTISSDTWKSLWTAMSPASLTTPGASYTVVWAINPAAGGSLSATSGSSTTVTPTSGWRYASPAYTVLTGAASVSQSTNTFTATPTANSTIRINMEEIPSHNIIFNTGGLVSIPNASVLEGATYNITETPAASLTPSCEYGTFVGWTTASTIADASVCPTIITSYTMSTADVTLYAVYSKTTGGGSSPTAYSAGDTGDFVIASYNTSNSKWYAIPQNPTVSSGKIAGVEITVSESGGVYYVTSANATGYTWNIRLNTNGSCCQSLYDAANSKALYHSNGGTSGTNLSYGTSTGYGWDIDAEGDDLTFQGVGISSNTCTTNSRGMLMNGTNFGGYALSNEGASGYYRIQVLPIASAGTTTYSLDANCCNPLGTINGSFSFTSVGTTGATANWGWTGATTGISKNILKVYKELDNSLVATIDNISASATSQAITGLDPCTEYYVKLTTVSSGGGYCDGVADQTGASHVTFTTSGYTVTKTGVTNVTAASLSAIPATTCASGFGPITIEAASGYVLPATITVTGATGSWTQATGSLTISDVTGNVSITITPTAATGWKFKSEADDWTEHAMTENAGVATCSVSLPADSRIEFCFDGNGTAYKNNGAIITTTSGWTFYTDHSNCRIHTGPAGTYTFDINTSTHAVTVTYPTVSHPNEHYVYFKNTSVWGTVKGYLGNTGNSNKAADWPGSDMQATTSICGETYHYAALNALSGTYNVIIFNNGSGAQTSDLSTTGSLGKYNANQDANWHDFTFYAITFAGNGNTGGSMTDVENICPGDGETIAANGYTRTGYTFANWKTNVAITANGSPVAANGDVPAGATISSINSNITLTAQWTANTISLTLNKNTEDAGSNNGSGSIDYDATSGTISTTPTRTGYSVEGYYTDAACTAANKVLTNTGAVVNSTVSGYTTSGKWTRATTPTTLYTKWTPNNYTVTWYAGGTASGNITTAGNPSTSVAYNSKVTDLPTNPDGSACDKVFVGWTDDTDYDHGTSLLFTDAAGSPAITGATNFYAVFATESVGSTTLLEEDFSEITTGNSTSTSGSSTTWGRNDNFSTGANTYSAGGAVRLGSGSNTGNLTTKQLTAAIGDEITVAFKVKGWSSVEGDISVSGLYSEFTKPSDITYTAVMNGDFESKSVTVTLTKANPYIIIATTAKRAFIDDLVITKSGTTYTGHTITCADCGTSVTPTFTAAPAGGTVAVTKGGNAVASGSTVKTCTSIDLSVTITPAAHYTLTGFTASGLTTGTATISPATNTVLPSTSAQTFTVTVSASATGTLNLTPVLTEDAHVAINWNVNGVNQSIAATEGLTWVYSGGDLTDLPSEPSVPAGCSGTKVFAGWSEKHSDATEEDASYYDDLFTTVGGAPTGISSAKTFYAVFATSSANPLAGETMWAEDFSGFSADDTPNTSYGSEHTGTTVYNSGSVTYACTNGGTTTKIYAANLAGGTSPEILVSKSNGQFDVTGIPTGGQTELTLTYKCNKGTTAFEVSSATGTVTVGDASVDGSTYTRTITISQSPSATNSFALTFKQTTSENARLDDISLVVPGSGTMTDYVTLCAPSYTITYNKNTEDAVTNLPSPTSVLQSTGSGTLSSTIPVRATYTFVGWAETTSGAVAYVAGGSITGVSADKTLYAVWTKTPVEELFLNYSELNKYVGDPAVTLEVTGVTPAGADATVTWSSNNSTVASVVAATGVVTFGTVGTATITATSTVTGTTTAYCYVTVRNKPTASFTDLIHDGNGTDLSTYHMQNVAGTAIVFPTLDDYATPGDDCDSKHYVFVGWTTSDNNDDPEDHLVTSDVLEDDQAKTFYAVWADGVAGVSYTQLTTSSFKTSPTKYVIGAIDGDDTFYFYSCAATDANNGNGGCTNAPGTNAPIQFTLSGTADALVATSTEATARYLTPLTAKNFQMSATSKTIQLNVDGTIANPSDDSWTLRFNTSEDYLRWYSSATGNAAYFYEVTAGAAVSYRTSCCTNNVPAPTVVATNTAYTVTLTWAAVDGATGYEVSWNGGAFTAATSPCVKSDLTASTDYTYKVRATYNDALYCGALVASGSVTTDDVYTVTYSGGTGTGSCSPSGSVATVSYEAGATVTLAPTNSFSLTSNTFAAWVVKDADDNDVPVSNNQFTMPAKNVTVTATWTAVQDKYYDRMHDGTDALHGGIADGEGKYYLVLKGCNYTVPTLTDDDDGDTDCHTTHFKLLGWIAQSHLKTDGSGEIKPGEESYIFQGGGTKSATGATYYAIWAIMTE